MTLVTFALIFCAASYGAVALRQIVGWAAPETTLATWLTRDDNRLTALIEGRP